MSERWRDLEATAERLEKTFQQARRRMTYSEEAQARHDIELIKDEARKQRVAYVNWLWGY